MGKSFTPKYRVEYRDNDRTHTTDKLANWTSASGWLFSCPTRQMAWNSKEWGAPNDKNLEQWRVKFNESYKSGGVNYHISLAARVLVHISHARIVNQKTGDIVAVATMPAFEVV